jgi:hypothetical protein
MPKTGQHAEVNTFIQGLITEASPLNFPPNASREEENFILNRDGTRHRRLGMDFEDDYNLRSLGIDFATFATSGKNVFKWTSVAGVAGKEFLVVQTANKLNIYDLSADSISGSGFLTTLTMTGFPTTDRVTFASLEGKLVATAGISTVLIVTFNTATSTFSLEDKRLLVRDLWGIQVATSSYEADNLFRGTTIPNDHRYNLQNQSWGIARKDKFGALDDPIDLYGALAIYPSNSEVVWTGLQFQPIVGGADPYERIYPNLYEERVGVNVDSPKGYYIIDLLDRGASRTTQFAANYARNPSLTVASYTAPQDKTLGGARLVVEFAGRAFYAGFSGELVGGDKRSPNLANFIVFSQLVKSGSDLVKCYQEGDPTSREGSDIVDTDGGFLRIADAENIIALEKLGSNLIVLAANGVWAISGGSDFGFTASNYKVTKISTYGCSSPESVVSEGGSIFYWGDGGIYKVAVDKYGQVGVTSITQTTIQSLYNSIPKETQDTCTGVFDEKGKRIVWLYQENTPLLPLSITKELVLDLTIGSFSINRIYNSFLSDIGALFPFYHNSRVMYLTAVTNGADVKTTFSYYRDAGFEDWVSHDGGTDAKAFMWTGSQIAGDSSIKKQIPYLTMHFRKTEFETDEFGTPQNQSSCLFRVNWDWANTANSNKITPLQQAYRYRKAYLAALPDTEYDNGFETVTTRNKVRGSGRSFGLYIETEPLKDCNVLGWNLTMNGNPIA